MWPRRLLPTLKRRFWRRREAKLFSAACRDEQGAVAVEMAAALPVLLTLFLAGTEATRFVIINQKIERTSATVGDLISRAEQLTEADVADLFQAGDQVMTPFNVSADGRLIVSSLIEVDGADTVVWQRTFGAGGAASRIGAPGAVPQLPDGFVIRPGENVITAEVVYDYAPLLPTEAFSGTQLYSSAFFRPRFGNLTNVLP